MLGKILTSFVGISLLSAANAAPFLGTKASFFDSGFCKTYTCKHVATVPSGVIDQFHYDVAGKYRVVIWRMANQRERIGSYNAPRAGEVLGVGVEWYGIQDTPLGSQEFVGRLMTFATGKSTSADVALKWMESVNDTRQWGNYLVRVENR